jgi:Na+/H+ antiporter NhaD/arsenite permease-like protein
VRWGIAAFSNFMNSLPAGLLAGSAIQAAHVAPQIRDAVLMGVALGANVPVTGSLAAVLWLIALRREGVQTCRCSHRHGCREPAVDACQQGAIRTDARPNSSWT